MCGLCDGRIKMITYRNDWMAHKYSVDGRDVRPIVVQVNLDKNDLGRYDVLAKNESGTYLDHGHSYGYSSTQCFIAIESPFGGLVCGPSLKEMIDKGYELILIQEA